MWSTKVRILPLSALALLFAFLFTAFANAEHNININTADSAMLQELNGVGPSKAQAIIDYRTQNGPFANIEDIQDVSGIGPTTYNNIKDHITVGSGSATDNASSPSPGGGNGSGSDVSSPVSSYVAPPSPELFAYAGEDRTVTVGADVELVGRAYNKNGDAVEQVRFLWNFGDGGSAEGGRALHRWNHPGRYAVVLDVAAGKEAASHRIVVTAMEAKVSVVVGGGGSIVVKNDSGRDLDLSRWLLAAGGKTFTLPANTVVLRGAEVAFYPSVTGLTQLIDGTVGLQYPNGTFAGKAGAHAVVPEVQPPQFAGAAVLDPGLSPVAKKEAVHAESGSSSEEEDVKGAVSTSSAAMTASTGGSSGTSYVWWLGAALLSFLGAGTVYAFRHAEREGWNIIDESTQQE